MNLIFCILREMGNLLSPYFICNSIQILATVLHSLLIGHSSKFGINVRVINHIELLIEISGRPNPLAQWPTPVIKLSEKVPLRSRVRDLVNNQGEWLACKMEHGSYDVEP